MVSYKLQKFSTYIYVDQRIYQGDVEKFVFQNYLTEELLNYYNSTF